MRCGPGTRVELKSVSLLQVQRQTNAEYKAAVETLRHQPSEGSASSRHGGDPRGGLAATGQEVSKAYREAAARTERQGEARSVLVVAATHDEIKSVTYAIRQDRKRAGELAEGESLPSTRPFNWTEAQKRRTQELSARPVAGISQGGQGHRKNEASKSLALTKPASPAAKRTARPSMITGRQAKAYGVFEKQRRSRFPR